MKETHSLQPVIERDGVTRVQIIPEQALIIHRYDLVGWCLLDCAWSSCADGCICQDKIAKSQRAEYARFIRSKAELGSLYYESPDEVSPLTTLDTLDTKVLPPLKQSETASEGTRSSVEESTEGGKL